MNPAELAASITALAIVLADTYTDDELQILASIFNQLGDTLSTISNYRDSLKDTSTQQTSGFSSSSSASATSDSSSSSNTSDSPDSSNNNNNNNK